MKKRIAVAAACWVGMTILLLPLAHDLHWLLSGRTDLLTLSPVAGLRSLCAVPGVRAFFLCGQGTILLVLGWCLFSTSYIKYRSDMMQLTPAIQTPKQEGQGQYGTARWLTEEEIAAELTTVRVDADSDLLTGLAAHGADDLEKGEESHA